MSTMRLNPQPLVLLAVLGIGAYWFMTRRAAAATLTPITPATVGRARTGGTSGNAPPKPNVLTGVLAGMDTWLNTQTPLPSTVAGQDNTPVNSPSDYQAGNFDPSAVNGAW